jgi:hypothetical protein
MDMRFNGGENEYSPTFIPIGTDLDSWWPSHLNATDLPPFRIRDWRLVLLGAEAGYHGGHLWESAVKRGIEKKTVFPREWGPAQVGEVAAKVLRKYAERIGTKAALLPTNTTCTEKVTVDSKTMIAVVSLSKIGETTVITTYPICGDGIFRLLNGQMVAQPLIED